MLMAPLRMISAAIPPLPPIRAADAPLCTATQGNRGGSPQSPVGHDDPGVPPSRPPQGVGADDHIGLLLGTTCVAPVGRGDHTPP